jgi:lysyl-tRNA synthetase class 1
MRELGMDLEYRYQTQKYTVGDYTDQIAFCLQHRQRIAEIQLSFKSEKGNEKRGITPEEFLKTYYPISVYSRFSGSDKTEVLSYDGNTTVTYRCLATDKTDTVDFKEHPIVKLQWKVDWPMRWAYENVHFEPSGLDHDTPGGARDVSSAISREIFRREPPTRLCYQFVGIQGMNGKMSGSKGGAIAPGTLLQFYEPEMLKWLYLRRAPGQSFNLAFDTEVYRQYDEFDREVAAFRGGQGSNTLTPAQRKTLSFSHVDPANDPSGAGTIPFKQAVALGQITQWNADKLRELAEKSGMNYSAASINKRLPKAEAWLVKYNPDEMIRLLDAPNAEYASKLDEAARDRIRKLRDILAAPIQSIADLEQEVYDIPKRPGLDEKETKQAQRQFFKDVYNLLIGKDTGPRLSTFLWAVDREAGLKLLDIG